MGRQPVDPDTVERLLVQQGVDALKAFYEEYEKNPTGRNTEFYRGKVGGWRHALRTFYGDYASDIIDRVRQTAKLRIPHAGPLAPDGTGYVGWDSDADTIIGKLES